MSGQQYDAPNQEAVGQPPPWEEGEGGAAGEAAEPEEMPDESEPSSDLDAMTKEELLAEAQRLGISPANNAMTKDELKAAIEAG